ncbi:MAG: response regulator [Nitrospirae bacterium]|nr:response regulator [Nitrospirota bacterium]
MTEPKRKILVADDEELIRRNLQDLLDRKGYEVVTCADGREALDAFKVQPFDAAIIDLRMPEIQGQELLEYMKAHDPSVPVVVLTGYGTVENAIECMKAGAFNFLCKPCGNLDILKVVEKAVTHRDNLVVEDVLARTATLSLRVAIGLTAESKRAAITTLLHLCAKTPYNHDRSAISVAVEEALSNAFKHGNKGDANKKVWLAADINEEALRVRVEDEGQGFNYQEAIAHLEDADAQGEYGSGLFLIQQSMDKIAFEEGGRAIVMTRFPTNSG